MPDFVVIDCCVTMAWLQLPAAKEKDLRYAQSLLPLFQEGCVALAPSLWYYEVSNVLTTLVRNQYIGEPDMMQFIDILRKLPIRICHFGNTNDIAKTVALAKEYKLSAYDASYLNLAYTHSHPLATVDKKLVKVAKQCDLYWQ